MVWIGTEPGICDTWTECQLRTKGYPGARYKSFDSQEEAVEAWRNGYEEEARQVLRQSPMPLAAKMRWTTLRYPRLSLAVGQ